MRFGRLDLNLLVALDVLIQERNVSVAARRLNLTQSALSGALNRLREYFDDELLVLSGRQMILTQKAKDLSKPVSDALLLIRSRIATTTDFDPSTTDRNFSIIASNFVFLVLLSKVMARAATLAPFVTFDIIAPDRQSIERLERGDADLLVTLGPYASQTHPRLPLFGDEPAVIAWRDGNPRDGLTAEAFFAAGHAVASFGAERLPAFTETYFAREGVTRRIEARVPTYSDLPYCVVGTDRLATMYRRHAAHFASFLPIRVLPMPIDMPKIVEEVQWLAVREDDRGLKWMISLMREVAREI